MRRVREHPTVTCPPEEPSSSAALPLSVSLPPAAVSPRDPAPICHADRSSRARDQPAATIRPSMKHESNEHESSDTQGPDDTDYTKHDNIVSEAIAASFHYSFPAFARAAVSYFCETAAVFLPLLASPRPAFRSLANCT